MLGTYAIRATHLVPFLLAELSVANVLRDGRYRDVLEIERPPKRSGQPEIIASRWGGGEEKRQGGAKNKGWRREARDTEIVTIVLSGTS